MRRKYGLSCDSVVEAEVVLADGRIVTASESENPDLFWALRGGGGNFGVVTSFTFELHELGPEVAFSATMYPLEDLADVMRWLARLRRRRSERGDERVVTMTFPENPEMPPEMHDRPVAIVGGVYAGPVDEGMEATAPLRELGDTRLRHVRARRRSSTSRPGSTRCSRATRCAPTGRRSMSTS